MLNEIYVLSLCLGGTAVAVFFCLPILKGCLAEAAEKERASW